MAIFLLVPGGWHGGWCFEAIADGLSAAGHVVQALTLAGPDGTLIPEANLEFHITEVVRTIETYGESVILLGHSYGGMVITGAADRIPEKVRSLVYVDAHVPENGDTVWSLTSQRYREIFITGATADGLTCRPPPNLDPRCRPHPMGAFLQAITLIGHWHRVPQKIYVGAHGWSGSPFLSLYERLKNDKEWTTLTLDCGHNIPHAASQSLIDILLNQT